VPELPALVMENIATEPSYVVGFPAYVGLTLSTAPQGTILTRVPAIGWSGTQGMVGLTLMPIGSTTVISARDASPFFDAEAGGTTRLGAGELRRILIDISELVPAQLAPGHYSIILSVGPENIRATSPRLNVSFRTPNDQEEAVLSQLREQVRTRGSWGQWTRLPPLTPDHPRRPWGPGDPLRFNLVLRELYYGSEALSQIGFDILDSLTGLFVPEREALRAELLAARGDTVGLARQLDLLKRDFPGLASWADAINDGRSDIGWTRRGRTTP
jgi:hypothetical protein